MRDYAAPPLHALSVSTGQLNRGGGDGRREPQHAHIAGPSAARPCSLATPGPALGRLPFRCVGLWGQRRAAETATKAPRERVTGQQGGGYQAFS